MLLNLPFMNFLYFTIQYISFVPFAILLNKHHIESKKCIFFAIFSALFSVIVSFILPNSSIISVLHILVVFLGYILIFNSDIYLSLVFAMICAISVLVSNIICISTNIFIFSKHYMTYSSLIVLCVAFICYNLLYKFNNQKLINYSKSMPELYFLALILISSYNATNTLNLIQAYTLMIEQIVLIITMLYIMYFKCTIQNFKLKICTAYFRYNTLKAITDDIRMFKHDYNNTLCSIGGYIALNDMNGLKKYYNKLTFDINKTNNTQMINPSTINEPSLYNLLVSKHNTIMQKNLSFNFYSSINYKNLALSPYDFSKILGILLDNAIDAANESTEKEISLCCEMNKNKDYQITVKNSYTNKDIDIKKIFSKGYSSKEIKSGLRTMGSF